MLITKFNAMIRNRLVWGVFAVIVSLSFLGFMGPKAGCRRGKDSQRQEGTVGVLNGKGVSDQAFFKARYFEMGMREQNAPRTAEGAQQLRKRTWKRIAALEAARKLGIEIGDEELGAMIRRDPSFTVNGAFNKDRYQSVISQQLRVPVVTFEEFLRESMILRKLVSVLQTVVWTVPSELSLRLGNLTDSMTAEYIVLRPDPAQDDKEPITDQGAEAFYSEHKEMLTIPERVKAKFVSFPLTNYYSTNEMAEADVEDYYEAHSALFSTNDTNGVSSQMPLDQVRPKILEAMAADASVFKARDEATEFSLQMIPDRNGKSLTFDEAASASNLTVQTTPFFTAMERVPGVDAGYAFTEAAFRIDTNDPQRLISDPVTGSNKVYVLTLAERKEPEIPAFDSVKDKVMSLARSNAVQKAFQARAEKTRDVIAKAVRSGATFTAAARANGLNVSTTSTFTVHEAMQTNAFAHSELIVPKVAVLRTNEVSELIAGGQVRLIASLTHRQPADFTTVDSFRPQLLSAVENYRAGVVFEEWADAILTDGQWEDFAPAEDETDAGKDQNAPTEDDTPPVDPAKPTPEELQNLM